MNRSAWILIGVAALVLIAAMLSVHDCSMQSALKGERERIESQYRVQIDGKDREIDDLRVKLAGMERDYGYIKGKIKRLETERTNLVAPQNLQELRDRFTALGYAPVGPGK